MIPTQQEAGTRPRTRARLPAAILLCAAAFCASAPAQLINGRFITSAYTWEKFDSVNASRTLFRGMQSALFDIAQGDFSVHTHIQLAPVLQSGVDDGPDYRTLYLYAKWRNIGNALDLSVGRMPYFVGVGSGTVDGGMATLRLFDNAARFTAYGGSNVPLDLSVQSWGPLKNNFALGGQILTTAVQNTRLGVSYTNKQRARPNYWAFRPDSLLNPVPQFIEPEPLKEQLLSGDVSYAVSRVTVYGRYDYDLDGKKTQRGQVGLRYYGMENFSFSADYIHRAPRVLYNSFFSIFNASNVDEVEGGIDYTVAPTARMFVRGAYVKYVDDKSFRYTVGFAHKYVSLSYRGGSGYAGELNSASLQGAYPFLDYAFVPTAGVSYSSYKLTAPGTWEDSFAGVLGATVRPVKSFSFDVQGQWLTNKVYKSDVRLFVELNYWFAQQLNLFR